ncbi:MAG: hypothetical protein FWC20_07655 [Oscillospiraceae bacterium]|nr:hypothetical protein [Oscillospiraceae bacterium]MCL2279264.1 hypothetical protein [Oscillospiraceae bacterium]
MRIEDISNDELIAKIERALQLNANNMNFIDCFHLCAKKSNLVSLMSNEHQIVFGRRGTGKTVTFKAFTHYINEVQENKCLVAWYSRLDSIIPTKVEIANGVDENEIIAIAIKKYLTNFLNFLYSRFSNIEKQYSAGKLKHFDKNKLDLIVELLIELDEAIKDGTKKADGIQEKITEIEEATSEGRLGVTQYQTTGHYEHQVAH